jgi:hypothetical protein
VKRTTAFEWQGLCYVEEGIIRRGAVTRASGTGDWQAFRYDIDLGYVPLGDYPTVERAQEAVERICIMKALKDGESSD